MFAKIFRSYAGEEFCTKNNKRLQNHKISDEYAKLLGGSN